MQMVEDCFSNWIFFPKPYWMFWGEGGGSALVPCDRHDSEAEYQQDKTSK